MSTRPSSLEIAGQQFRVEWIGPGVPMPQGASDPYTDRGVTFMLRQLVVVRDDMAHEAERETVVHEVLHAILRLGYHLDRLDGDSEEAIVAALAVGLLAALRHNPGLADYLTALEVPS